MDSFWSAQLLWVLAGVAFLLAELVWPGFVLLFFALGAFAAAFLAYALGLGSSAQIWTFLLASLAGLVLLRRMFLRVFRGRTLSAASEGEVPGLDDIGAGKLAVVTRAVGPGVSGEIKFRGSFWRAESAEALGEGENVVILGLAQNDSGAYLVRSATAAAQSGGQ